MSGDLEQMLALQYISSQRLSDFHIGEMRKVNPQHRIVDSIRDRLPCRRVQQQFNES